DLALRGVSVCTPLHSHALADFLLSLFSFRGAPRARRSFPTRRSSDLPGRAAFPLRPPAHTGSGAPPARRGHAPSAGCAAAPASRSEEHTSELQSRFDLVCRLLLEKKKYPEVSRLNLPGFGEKHEDKY